MSLSKEVNFAHAQRPIPCETCEDEVPGVYYCIDCMKTLCEECEKFHNKITKNHKVILRTQLADTNITSLSCAEHGEKVSFHCERCDKSVCGKCITGIHQGHKMVELKEAIERKMKLLQCKKEMIQENVLSHLLKQREEMTTEKEEYEKQVKKMIEKMEAENKALHDKLDQSHHRRMESINTYKETLLDSFYAFGGSIDKKIEYWEERASKYENALRNNSFADVIQLADGGEEFPHVSYKPALPAPPSSIPADVQDIVEDLEKLQPIPHLFRVMRLKQITPNLLSKFKCPLRGYPRICITREGNVWLGASESKKLVMVDIKGQSHRKKGILHEPFSLAVLSCGDIIMSPESNNLVCRLFTNGREEIILESSSSKYVGVSVNSVQEVLICTSNGKVLKIHRSHDCFQPIYEVSGHFSTVHSVQHPNGNIYITNWALPAVLVISKDGLCLYEIKQTTEGNALEKPLGLVVDRIGNILCADQAKNCVYIIDEKHQMRKLIGKDIKEPQWLAIDNDNNLWITQKNGTISAVKYLS